MSSGTLIVVGVMAVVGVVLIVRGVRPRRRGDTPHCRRCGYNLTGLTSDRCPECGAMVAAGGVVYGERQRRPVMAGAGVFLLVIGTPLAAIGLSRVDWYRLAPTSLLMMQIQGASPRSAWSELDRRIKAGALSDGQHARLIELALKEQGAAQASTIREQMLDYLGDCFACRRLSKEQEKRFFDQIVVFDLKVRSTVVLGDPVPYEVSYQNRGPSSGRGLWHELKWITEGALDGKPLPLRGHMSTTNSGTGSGALGSTLQCKTAGRHALTLAGEVVVYSGPAYDGSTGTVMSRRRVSLDGTFEVAASEPPGYIRRVKDASMGSLMRAVAGPRRFEWRSGSGRELAGVIELRAVPVSVAFDVIARIEGREYSLGSVSARRGKENMSFGVGSGNPLPVEPRPEVDIILRSSEKVARGTVDLFEIWEGELVFEDIPVTGVPATSSSLP